MQPYKGWQFSWLILSKIVEKRMYKLRQILSSGLLSLVAAIAITNPVRANEVELVREVFSDYKSAILANNGQVVASNLSQSSIDYYRDMQKLAICAQASEVKAKSFVNRMQVLVLRLRVPTEFLTQMSGQEVVVYAVERGWVGKESVTKLQLGEVTISEPIALGEALSNGRSIGAQFRFIKESDMWKLDLTPLLKISNTAMVLLAREMNVEENELLFRLVESVSDRQLTQEVWEPVAPNDLLCQ